MRPQGRGTGSQLREEASQVSRALLQAGIPPWGESRDVHPPLRAPTSLGLRALGAETAPVGGQDTPMGMRALPGPCPRPLTGLCFHAGDGLSGHHQEPHQRRDIRLQCHCLCLWSHR